MPWVRRLFASWTEIGEFAVFVSVCVAGIANASWLWVVIGGLVLLLLGWGRYRELFAKAGRIDADWRELGSLVRAFKAGSGLELYARAHTLLLVLGAKVGFDCLFLCGGFLFGHVIRWLWLS
jgi:hypothetical protein